MIETGFAIVLVLIASNSCASLEDVVLFNSPPLKYYDITDPYVDYEPPFGVWEYCDKGEYAVAARARVDPQLRSGHDGYSFSGFCIYCAPIGQPFDRSNKSRQKCSMIADYGVFKDPIACPSPFFITGLQVANDPPYGSDDPHIYWAKYGKLFGITTIRFFCSNKEMKEFMGYSQETITDRVDCLSGQAICGISTQVEESPPRRRDGAGLMNIRFKCCDVETPGFVETCKPSDRWETVKSCNNLRTNSTLECDYTVSVGTSKATMASQTKSMQLSMEASASLTVGYNYESQLLGLKTDISATVSGSVGKTTGYDWSKESSDTFSSMTTTTTKMMVPAGYHSTLFQVVGECGVFTVRSSTLVRVDTKTDRPAPHPKPLPRGFFCDKASNMTATNIPNPNAKDKVSATLPTGT